MNKLLCAFVATTLAALPVYANAQAAKPDIDAQVHCALVFSVVARAQNQGLPGADRFPAMDDRGKAFFVATGMRLLDERKLTIDAMEPFFIARLAEVDRSLAESADRDKALDDEYARCLPMFAAVAPDAVPPAK